MRQHYYLTELSESPFQLSIGDALNLGLPFTHK